MSLKKLKRIEDYDKNLPIVEIYTAVQSEGSRAGYPTVVIRTTGCTHRCYFGEGGWCDSWYTSIHPEKGHFNFKDIIEMYKKNPHIKEMMLTGGSPTMHSALVNELTHFAHENNIFITPNYQWAFHVTNNKTIDHTVYTDWQHWQNTYDELFTSGRAFKDIDKIEGTPNPWFQKWLSHPSFDSYYQAMLPYKQDYAKINIPVLSITGYYGASISAIDFLTNHYKY